MPKSKLVTVCLLIGAVVILGAWDIYAAANHSDGDTISAIILNTSKRFPILPFIMGVLMGHFFWPNKGKA